MMTRKERQCKFFSGTMEELIPQDHFLRKVDKLVNFDFIYEKVAPLYSDVGRPSIDPVLMMKMLLVGYLYRIDSERKIEDEINFNIAYKWFVGLDIDEKAPDHCTFSQLRRRKFGDNKIFEEIFEQIVRVCMDKNLVDGELLLTDSTHIKANVKKENQQQIIVEDTPSEYIKKLDKEAYETGLINEPVDYTTDKIKTVVKSTTDPDCGLMCRERKPKQFAYLCHETTDSKNGIIVAVKATAGNVTDNVPYVEQVTTCIDKFDFKTKAVAADSGYDTAEIYNEMYKRGIDCYIIPQTRGGSSTCKSEIKPKEFSYDELCDIYICPEKKILTYRNYQKKNGYKAYYSDKKDCANCPRKNECIGKKKSRIILRHLHEKARAAQKANIGKPEYEKALDLRQVWCEGNFSRQKSSHNLNGTRKRGIAKIQEQCLLSACALNLKRLVKCVGGGCFLINLMLILDPAGLFRRGLSLGRRICKQDVL